MLGPDAKPFLGIRTKTKTYTSALQPFDRTLPGFPAGMAIGQHGSWNRSKLSGYKLAFVEFQNGKPVGMPREILKDFLSPDEKHSYGRPVGVAVAGDGAVLMADDVGDVIWRVTGA